MKIEPVYTTDGMYIRDRQNRVVMLRGCNLGGDSKIPAYPPGNPLEGDVSFIGRPFPVTEADSHFARLVEWGFTFIRFVFTWEAVEHEGPGIYDEEYLSYLREILKKAEDHGITVYMDPHQDAWSRWTGGDGAPGWTLSAIGFDLSRIAESGSALTVQHEGSLYQPMCWGMNNLLYGAACMNTLFFGGNRYAPELLIEGIPVQEYLQSHYIDAMRHTARRLKDCLSIIGIGTMNEPHPGFIGLSDLRSHERITAASGAVPSAFDAMAAASGFTRRIKKFTLFGKLILPGYRELNPDRVSIFRDGFVCPWRTAGVWDVVDGQPVLLKPDFFAGVNFHEDFLKPFQRRFMDAFEKKHRHFIFFPEGVPMRPEVMWTAEDRLRDDGSLIPLVDGMHWYDGITLLRKKWNPAFSADSEEGVPVFGKRAVAESFRRQLSRQAYRIRSRNLPALLGEFGVPFDLDRGKSFKTGDYRDQEEALSLYYDAIDANLLHSTIWNYSASNTHADGDFWNTEDLSIYCAASGGGRAVRGFSRPYPMATSGIPVRLAFNTKRRECAYEWDGEPGITELYVPSHWYPEGWTVCFEPAPDGKTVVDEKPAEQRLIVSAERSGRERLIIRPLT